MKRAFVAIFAALVLLFPSVVRANDISGHWAEGVINNSVSKGFISFYEDGSFRPNDPIFRKDFIRLVNRSMGFVIAGSPNFSDVRYGDSFYEDVAVAVNAGYINGYEDGTFRPYDTIVRETAAVIISSVLELSPNEEYAAYFTDSGSLSWSKPYVGAAVKARLLTGYPTGDFRPNNQLTRAEAVSLVARTAAQKGSGSLDTTSKSGYSPQIIYDQPYVSDERAYYQTSGNADSEYINSEDYVRIGASYYGNTKSRESFNKDIYYMSRGGGTVENISTSGSFYIANSIGNGTLTLNNVDIDGTLSVYSINKLVLNNCKINSIENNKRGGDIEIVTTGSSVVSTVYLQGRATLSQDNKDEQGFRNVEISEDYSDSGTIYLNGNYNHIGVYSKDAYIRLDAGKTSELVIYERSSGTNLNLTRYASLERLDVNSSCYIEGNGRIGETKVNTQNSLFALRPEKVSGRYNPSYTDGAVDGSYQGDTEKEHFRVKLRIVDYSNMPLSGVSVLFGVEKVQYTDAEGYVVFDNIVNGSYDCRISTTSAGLVQEIITVRDGDVTKTISYDTAVNYSVVFIVKESGQPIPNISVYFGGTDTVTDSTGKAEFTGVYPGTYSYNTEYSGITKTGTVEVLSRNMVMQIWFP